MAVYETYNCDELEASEPVIIEGDIRQPEQIQIIAAPHFHLFDVPGTGKSGSASV